MEPVEEGGGAMVKRSLPLSKVYRLLGPGPVIMLATVLRGKANVMPMSWHTMVDFEPPLIGLIVSNRNHTFAALKATKECTINIPAARFAKKVVACGNVSGRKVDKFRRFGLTPVPASRVKAPLVAECFANLECRVVDARMATKYNLFIVKVVAAWIDSAAKRPRTLHHEGGGDFFAAGRRLRVANRKP